MAFERMTENVMNISGLPNVVVGQASMLKNTFDKSGKDMKTFINNFLDVLESQIASQSIGASVETVPEKTVQAILTAFESEILNRYTKAETDTLVSTDTNNLIEDFDINLTTGVITITKKDGTTETFDTAIEKVPATFEIVESGSSVFLKITNVDGTSTQTDITELMNVYEFLNSDDIAFTMTGTGNEKKVTANIRNNSIGIEKFSLSVISQFEGYVTSASNSATQAQGYAQQANTSKEQAASSASQATNQANNAQSSATSASNSANTATTKANEASESASLASTKAKTAESYAHGGTGTRQGEDTDNAKYYAEIAKEVAGGDFVTPTEMEGYAQPLGTTPTFETTELSGQEIEVETLLAMESVLQLSGNSEQDSRSGKNLLKTGNAYTTTTIRGITFTVNDDKSVTINGTNDGNGNSAIYLINTSDEGLQLSAGTYKVPRTGNNNVVVMGYTGSKYSQIISNYQDTYTVNEDTNFVQVYIQIANGVTETFNNFTFYPIIVDNTKSLEPYEPYGVQPSPDYPSEIRSVKSKSDNVLKLFTNSGSVTHKGTTVEILDYNTIKVNGTPENNIWMEVLSDFKNGTETKTEVALPLENTLYTASCFVESGSWNGAGQFMFGTTDGTNETQNYFHFGNSKSFNGQNGLDRIFIYLGAGVTYNNVVLKLQLVKGDKALPYQPYGYVPVELKVEGKNKLDKNAFDNPSINLSASYNKATHTITFLGDANTANGIFIKLGNHEIGKTYTFSCYIKGPAKRQPIIGYAGKNQYPVLTGDWQRYSETITAEAETNTLIIYSNYPTGGGMQNGDMLQIKDWQLEESPTTTPYEPYVEPTTVQLPLGDIELRSTPDGTRDTFARVDGVWNKVGNIATKILTGKQEDGNTFSNITSYGDLIRYDIQGLFGAKPVNENKCLCSSFTMVYGSDPNYESARNSGEAYPTTFVFYLKKDRMGNPTTDAEALTAMQTWLADNPTEVIYPLAEPIYTPITDQALISALDELEQLILHKGYNYITATAVNGVKAQLDLFIPSTASVTEVQETESSIDMPVLVAVGDGDVKPKIPKENKMTLNPTTGEIKVNREKIATETYVKNAVANKADKTYVDEVVEGIVVPNIQASTTDLEAGTSELPTGNIHLVYE